MNYKWNEFEQKLEAQNYPPEYRFVLVQIAEQPDKGLPPAVAVGYLRYSAGDKTCPLFIVPGVVHQTVTHWCDCLMDDFYAPSWNQNK